MAQKQTKRGKTNQTSEWHDLVMLFVKAGFRDPRFVVSRFCVFASVLYMSVEYTHDDFYTM